jgi:hypothetical protein
MSTEQATSYDGPFSTWTERHSFIFGFVPGISLGWSRTVRREVRKEPHYALGGLLVGAVVAFALQQWGD